MGLLLVRRARHRGAAALGLRPPHGGAHAQRVRRPRRRDGWRRGARPPSTHRRRSWWRQSRGRRTSPMARRRLHPVGAHVVAVADAPALPFAPRSFDLVVSRHPVVVLWDEIARVLRPGGTYLSQQIGAGTNRELTDFLDGAAAAQPRAAAPNMPVPPPQRPASRSSSCGRARSAWSSSTSQRSCTSCARCPGPSRVSRRTPTRNRCAAMHAHIARAGSFVSTAAPHARRGRAPRLTPA